MGPDYPSRILVMLMRHALAHRGAQQGDVVHGRQITFWYGLPQVKEGQRRPPPQPFFINNYPRSAKRADTL
jgi:hypothetical protein